MSTPWYDNPITNPYSTVAVPGNWDTPHYGVDIGLPQDTPLTDLLAGKVVKADYAPWGGEVFIQLANGLEEYYYHLDQIDVSVGQQVNVGQLLGLSGGQNSGGAHPVSTLYSSGPHVHFGITNGTVVAGPSGQQYYGIDPTSIITEARNGTLAGIGTGGTSTNNTLGYNPSLDPTGISEMVAGINALNTTLNGDMAGINQVGSFFTNTNNFFNSTDWKDVSIRGGLILVGVVIVIMGIFLFVG